MDRDRALRGARARRGARAGGRRRRRPGSAAGRRARRARRARVRYELMLEQGTETVLARYRFRPGVLLGVEL
ncbi:hypothetical protein ACMHYB_11575 [Sorangium sp. So ce1128]